MRKLAGIILAVSLGFGAAVTLPAAPAIARDTDLALPWLLTANTRPA